MITPDEIADDQLPALLRVAVRQAIAYLQERGIGPELPRREYVVRWMEQQGAGASGKEETREEPSFFLPEESRTGLYELSAVKALLSTAANYAATNGRFFPGLNFRGPDGTAQGLLGDYFLRAGSLRLDDEVITTICAAFTNDLSSDTAVIKTIFMVENLSAEEAFQLSPEITFRPINKEDIDRYGRVSDLSTWFYQQPLVNDHYWVCEIIRRGTKVNSTELNRHRKLGEQIVVALNLATPGRAILTLFSNHLASPYLNFGNIMSGNIIATSRIGKPIHLTKNRIKEFQWTFAKVTAIQEQATHAFLRLPLRRLRLASTRQESEDQLVDYVIGLERLLACQRYRTVGDNLSVPATRSSTPPRRVRGYQGSHRAYERTLWTAEQDRARER